MAEAPTSVPAARASPRRCRGALLLVGLTGSVAVLTVVAWFALASSPGESSFVARDGRVASGAGRPPALDVAESSPPPLEAGGVSRVALPRSVASPVLEDEREHWSRPQPGVTEPWLRVQMVDATTGAPLESAIVRAAASAEALAAQDDRVTSARVDGTGVAKLWDPPRGLGRELPWLLASAARHAPSLLPVTAAVPTGTHAFCVRGRTIVLPLPVARPLTVRVVRRDERGSSVAVEGARVVARAPWSEEADWFAGDRSDSQLRRLLTFEGTTDAKGEAAFVPIARQPWRIHVAATGFDSEDRVLTAAQAQEGEVEVALRELFVAAVALPANSLAASPSLEWDGTPAWFAPATIEWIPDHLTREEHAAATVRLARRRDVAESLEPDNELRCRFATLHSAALAEGRPAAVPAQVKTLPGEEPVDVTLSFVPFEHFSRDDVFAVRAPPIGGTGRVRFTWSDAPATPAHFVGSLTRNGADDPIFLRDFAFAPGEFNLDLPPGLYFLVGNIGGHMLVASFAITEGGRVLVELLKLGETKPTPHGLLGWTGELPLLAVHDSLGRVRLHYELTIEPSDVPDRRASVLSFLESRVLTRRSRSEPADPFSGWGAMPLDLESRIGRRKLDLTLEAFGCVPAFLPRVRLDSEAPPEFELALDESAATTW